MTEWVRCSERMPPVGTDVTVDVCLPDDTPFVTTARYLGGGVWRQKYGLTLLSEWVETWMFLPEDNGQTGGNGR